MAGSLVYLFSFYYPHNLFLEKRELSSRFSCALYQILFKTAAPPADDGQLILASENIFQPMPVFFPPYGAVKP